MAQITPPNSGGGGGTPGGSSGQTQYNNGGAFGGFTVSGDGTLNTGTGVLAVTKVNSGSIPASAPLLISNVNNQIVTGANSNQTVRQLIFTFSTGGPTLSGTTAYCSKYNVTGTVYVATLGVSGNADSTGSGTITLKTVATGSYTGPGGFSGYTALGAETLSTAAQKEDASPVGTWSTVTLPATPGYICAQLTSPAVAAGLTLVVGVHAN